MTIEAVDTTDGMTGVEEAPRPTITGGWWWLCAWELDDVDDGLFRTGLLVDVEDEGACGLLDRMNE